MSQPETGSTSPTRDASPRSPARLALGGAAAVALASAFWFAFGRGMLGEFQAMRKDSGEAEDSRPVNYKGIAYRRSYNDRPPVFHFEKDGRQLLWAAKGGPDGPEFYDVTEADFLVKGLQGGYGRDSLPGLDAPIVEAPSGPIAREIPRRLAVHGVELASGPRAYPEPMLAKVVLANDRDGEVPIVVVRDGRTSTVGVHVRAIDDRPITFGTTGYDLKGRPLLYDRRTRSLWMPGGAGLACVSGALRGTTLPAYRPAEATTWGDWLAEHPASAVAVGSDRALPEDPIPAE